MNYNLMPLKYFVDVVQTHGFGSAAKRNYVSETAVSSAIKKLESDLGNRLLNRQGGQLSLTPTGQLLYQRAIVILNFYNEIWHHPESHPEKLLRVHFLQGLENEAALLARNLPVKYKISLDEESFDTSISHLLKGNYDILIGFQLEFTTNSKIRIFPLEEVSFDLLFNRREVAKQDGGLQELAQNARIYMHNWKSTGILDIQTAMLEAYSQDGWDYGQVEQVNSFAAACLNVNFKGGMTMVPSSFSTPNNCENIYRFSPKHFHNRFKVVAAINSSSEAELAPIIKRAITSGC